MSNGQWIEPFVAQYGKTMLLAEWLTRAEEDYADAESLMADVFGPFVEDIPNISELVALLPANAEWSLSNTFKTYFRHGYYCLFTFREQSELAWDATPTFTGMAVTVEVAMGIAIAKYRIIQEELK